MLIKELS